MKIDFPPVRCFDEAVIFPGVKVLDAAVACFRMMLHLTAKFAHDVFDLSHCSVEGLPDRDQRVFALGRVGMGLVDNDLVVLGHRDAKLDLEAAAPMSGLRPGDDDATTCNARTESFETLHLRGDLGSDLFGRPCQSKFYTACLRLRAGQSSTVFAHESPTRSAGFGAENGLYLFALTVPTATTSSNILKPRTRGPRSMSTIKSSLR